MPQAAMQTCVSSDLAADPLTLVWFKRDLRVTDHPALQSAASGPGRVLPVYIIEPDYWRLPDMSGRHWGFIAECLHDLQADLTRLGTPLALRVGDAVETLEDLRQKFGFTQMISHIETGNLWSFARDQRVANWARAQGVVWSELPQSAVTRGIARANRWAERRGRFVAEAVSPIPPVLRGVKLEPGTLPSAASLGLVEGRPDTLQLGGRRQAERVLEDFLQRRGQPYRRAMSSPLSAEMACSRLSPYLAYGAITVREVVQATARRQAELKGSRSGWLSSLSSFQSRLAWRDHFTQKLEDQPDIETKCLHPAYEGLRPEVPDPALFLAWKTGQTGVPFVDACMRYLIATGWLNFRMRAMLMSFASYQLWLDWRSTGLHLARLFTDYEPGIHWPQVQMQSGTTGINTIRIYNPVKQGLDQDPDGIFTRRWVPELAPVPDVFLQEPWRWDGRGTLLGVAYPRPVVDLKTAVSQARDRVWAVRKDRGFAAKAGQILTKHASRKDSAGHFVNDRAPRRPRRASGDDRQMSFDL